MFKKIKNKIYIFHNIYIKHKYLKRKKSYSMDGEDLIICDYFRDKKKGFYIDVGCYHPIHRNNTFLLHKRGWHGINIDIHKFSIELFNYLRPEDLNFNFAITNKSEFVDMYFQKELSQISTIEKKRSKEVFQGKIKSKKIQAFTLDEVLNFSNLGNKKIDLLDIDVEGADLKVLKGLSFEKTKPELVCVEIHEENIRQSETFEFLYAKGYELIWSGIFSHIFKLINKD